ncbi:MAG: electron transport complex subunit RsxC, partial [Proteobacteria bacterium]|nr:electron transport complex subunit RsxC [Pseudomonadota bacterium]
VFKGQVIAEPESNQGAYVHAPTSGVVIAIENRHTASPDVSEGKVISIKSDGNDQWIDDKKTSKNQLGKQEIIEKLYQAGIIGMGGAGFPIQLKYRQSKSVNTLIINGAECEPYISCDERLMLDFPEEIIGGTLWLMEAADCDKAIIAMEDNVGQVKTLLEGYLNRRNINNIAVIKVPTIYPTGGEKQLIKVLTGLEVPSRQTPMELGIVMQNVATAKAVFDALEHDRPLIDRLVTVTGDALAKPGNYLALIGTTVEFLLEQAGCESSKTDKVVIGGPMMGYAMPDTQIGIDKTTNCILALSAENTRQISPEMPCIRCGDCVKVCPQELLPQQLLWYINGNDHGNNLEKARAHHVFDCIECGACSWVCPSQINLVDYYRFAKSELVYLDHKKTKSEQAKLRFDQRELRLATIKAERQAKRRHKAARMHDTKTAKKEMSAVLARVKAKASEKQSRNDEP